MPTDLPPRRPKQEHPAWIVLEVIAIVLVFYGNSFLSLMNIAKAAAYFGYPVPHF